MYDGSPGKSFPNIFFEHTYPLFSLLRGAPIQTAPKPSLNMRKTALPIQELSLGDYDIWRTFMIFSPNIFSKHTYPLPPLLIPAPIQNAPNIGMNQINLFLSCDGYFLRLASTTWSKNCFSFSFRHKTLIWHLSLQCLFLSFFLSYFQCESYFGENNITGFLCEWKLRILNHIQNGIEKVEYEQFEIQNRN